MNDLTVSSSPHIKAPENTRSIMLDVLIALSFPLAVSVYFFGLRTLTLTALSVFCCVLFEYLYRKILKKPDSIGDLSAPVTGILLAFCLPVSVPYWIIPIGAFFAIVVVKQLYGGLGLNFLNPALAARVLLSGFAVTTVYTRPLLEPNEAIPVWGFFDPSLVSAATPLSHLNNAEQLAFEGLPLAESSWTDLFLGQIPGAFGEVSSALLLLGGVYLCIRRVISPRIPLAFLGTVALLTYFFPQGDVRGLDYMLFSLLSGSLVLGAIFMATDHTTSPVTRGGQWIFGIGCGLLTVFLRTFGDVVEGVWWAILLMNLLVWVLDKIGAPRRFGRTKEADKP